MRANDRDLIRGGHYGQRSCEPHPKAEHMAAPTNAANVKKALIHLLKSRPGQLNYGSGGNGTQSHLAGEILGIRTGTHATHIPYKGIAPAITDLLAGQL